jgi:predicted O-methyltransferase YrrM
MTNVLERLFCRRPRILNFLHRFHIVHATSQTNELELAALARYASGVQVAVEIGTHQGVSAARIAASLEKDGTLFCIDPWPEVDGRTDPSLQICRRHLRRTGTQERVRIIYGFSRDVADSVPEQIEFAFIDGDHSLAGIETDWHLIAPRMVKGGVICLHDTAIPSDASWRQFDSTRFYDRVIAVSKEFETIETIYSMRVVRKV